MAEEIGQLKRLARRGEDRARLGELMEHISDKTATTVVQQAPVSPQPQPKVRAVKISCIKWLSNFGWAVHRGCLR